MKMKICNEDIRNEIKEAGLFLWQVADRLGINDTYFSKKLRYEFSPEKKAQIRAIIAELEAEE